MKNEGESKENVGCRNASNKKHLDHLDWLTGAVVSTVFSRNQKIQVEDNLWSGWSFFWQNLGEICVWPVHLNPLSKGFCHNTQPRCFVGVTCDPNKSYQQKVELQKPSTLKVKGLPFTKTTGVFMTSNDPVGWLAGLSNLQLFELVFLGWSLHPNATNSAMKETLGRNICHRITTSIK